MGGWNDGGTDPTKRGSHYDNQEVSLSLGGASEGERELEREEEEEDARTVEYQWYFSTIRCCSPSLNVIDLSSLGLNIVSKNVAIIFRRCQDLVSITSLTLHNNSYIQQSLRTKS